MSDVIDPQKELLAHLSEVSKAMRKHGHNRAADLLSRAKEEIEIQTEIAKAWKKTALEKSDDVVRLNIWADQQDLTIKDFEEKLTIERKARPCVSALSSSPSQS